VLKDKLFGVAIGVKPGRAQHERLKGAVRCDQRAALERPMRDARDCLGRAVPQQRLRPQERRNGRAAPSPRDDTEAADKGLRAYCTGIIHAVRSIRRSHCTNDRGDYGADNSGARIER
jgi:hypothetical protein